MFGFMKRQLNEAVSQGVREGLDEIMPDLLRRVTTNALVVAAWAVCKDCKDNSPNPPTYVKSSSPQGYSGYTHLISRTQTNEWCAASEIWKLIERGTPAEQARL